jgi:hypothetical protein
MQRQSQKRKLTLNKKTVMRLNTAMSSMRFMGGGTVTCPTYTCPNTNPPDPGLTPGTKCIGQTSAPITLCAPIPSN